MRLENKQNNYSINQYAARKFDSNKSINQFAARNFDSDISFKNNCLFYSSSYEKTSSTFISNHNKELKKTAFKYLKCELLLFYIENRN